MDAATAECRGMAHVDEVRPMTDLSIAAQRSGRQDPQSCMAKFTDSPIRRPPKAYWLWVGATLGVDYHPPLTDVSEPDWRTACHQRRCRSCAARQGSKGFGSCATALSQSRRCRSCGTCRSRCVHRNDLEGRLRAPFISAYRRLRCKFYRSALRGKQRRHAGGRYGA